MDSSLLNAQRGAGKKFTDAEVVQHIDGLFAQNAKFRSSFLDLGGGQSQPMLRMKVGDIPSRDVERIRKALKTQGNDQPTDADVLGASWAGKAIAKSRPVPTADNRKLVVSALTAEGIGSPTNEQIEARFNLKHGIR